MSLENLSCGFCGESMKTHGTACKSPSSLAPEPSPLETIASLQNELEKANLEIMRLAEQLDDKPKSVKDRKKRNSSEETDSAASAVALIAALVCLVCICIGRGAEAIAAAIIHATAVYDYHTSL